MSRPIGCGHFVGSDRLQVLDGLSVTYLVGLLVTNDLESVQTATAIALAAPIEPATPDQTATAIALATPVETTTPVLTTTQNPDRNRVSLDRRSSLPKFRWLQTLRRGRDSA